MGDARCLLSSASSDSPIEAMEACCVGEAMCWLSIACSDSSMESVEACGVGEARGELSWATRDSAKEVADAWTAGAGLPASSSSSSTTSSTEGWPARNWTPKSRSELSCCARKSELMSSPMKSSE